MIDEWIMDQMHAQKLEKLRGMSKEQLRRLWDTLGDDSFSDDFDCADIHRVMNESGDGDYCAV